MCERVSEEELVNHFKPESVCEERKIDGLLSALVSACVFVVVCVCEIRQPTSLCTSLYSPPAVSPL